MQVTITTPTAESPSYAVAGSLSVGPGGSLYVGPIPPYVEPITLGSPPVSNLAGFLDVTGNISNEGLPAGIVVNGTLSSGGSITNGPGDNFVVQGIAVSIPTGSTTLVQGASVSSVAGNLDNSGFFPSATAQPRRN